MQERKEIRSRSKNSSLKRATEVLRGTGNARLGLDLRGIPGMVSVDRTIGRLLLGRLNGGPGRGRIAAPVAVPSFARPRRGVAILVDGIIRVIHIKRSLVNGGWRRQVGHSVNRIGVDVNRLISKSTEDQVTAVKYSQNSDSNTESFKLLCMSLSCSVGL